MKSLLIPFNFAIPNGLTLSPSTLLKELLLQFRDKLHLLNSTMIRPTHGGQAKGLTREYILGQTKPNFIRLGNHASNIDTINVIFASCMDTFSGIVPSTLMCLQSV